MITIDRVSWRGFDWALVVAVFLLCAIGFAAIYSVDLSRGAALIYTKKQFIAFGIGLIFLAISAATAPTFFKNYAKWIYALSLLLLAAVLFFGATIRGTRGWFDFGGFSVQPVEFAKIGVILMLAYIAVNFGRRFDKPLFFFGTGTMALLPIVFTLFQPDLGSALLIGAIWFGIMWLVGARRIFLVLLVVVFAFLSVVSWHYLFADYQKERILTFADPARDPLGSGYNTIQATIAIGSGGIFGRGLGFGSQSQLRFLPETQTDFIFSVIGEELGLAGVLVVLVLYLVIFWRLLVIARQANNDFSALVAAGTGVLLFSQFFINIGANIGLLPVTGVTLPFVSYGGSSMVAGLFLIGIVESLNHKIK